MACSSGRASTMASLSIRSSRTGSLLGRFITSLPGFGEPTCGVARPRDRRPAARRPEERFPAVRHKAYAAVSPPVHLVIVQVTPTFGTVGFRGPPSLCPWIRAAWVRVWRMLMVVIAMDEHRMHCPCSWQSTETARKSNRHFLTAASSTWVRFALTVPIPAGRSSQTALPSRVRSGHRRTPAQGNVTVGAVPSARWYS